MNRVKGIFYLSILLLAGCGAGSSPAPAELPGVTYCAEDLSAQVEGVAAAFEAFTSTTTLRDRVSAFNGSHDTPIHLVVIEENASGPHLLAFFPECTVGSHYSPGAYLYAFTEGDGLTELGVIGSMESALWVEGVGWLMDVNLSRSSISGEQHGALWFFDGETSETVVTWTFPLLRDSLTLSAEGNGELLVSNRGRAALICTAPDGESLSVFFNITYTLSSTSGRPTITDAQLTVDDVQDADGTSLPPDQWLTPVFNNLESGGYDFVGCE